MDLADLSKYGIFPMGARRPDSISSIVPRQRLAGNKVCYVDFEADVSPRGTVPIEAGIVIDDREIRILWRQEGGLTLDAIGRTGRDVIELSKECKHMGLDNDSANELFRMNIPEDYIIMHYTAGIDITCLKYIYGNNRRIKTCDASVFLPKRWLPPVQGGKPRYEFVKLSEHALRLNLPNIRWHNALEDAKALKAIVSHYNIDEWTYTIV